MADTLTRRSPLQGYETRFAGLPASATIDDEPFVAMVDLWVDPTGPGGAAVRNVLGVDGLPTTASTAVSGADGTVIWLGPQEWLITSQKRDGEEIEALIPADLRGFGEKADAQHRVLLIAAALLRLTVFVDDVVGEFPIACAIEVITNGTFKHGTIVTEYAERHDRFDRRVVPIAVRIISEVLKTWIPHFLEPALAARDIRRGPA